MVISTILGYLGCEIAMSINGIQLIPYIKKICIPK